MPVSSHDIAEVLDLLASTPIRLAVVIRDDKGQERFARVKVPNTLPRLLPIKRSSGGTRRGSRPRPRRAPRAARMTCAAPRPRARCASLTRR